MNGLRCEIEATRTIQYHNIRFSIFDGQLLLTDLPFQEKRSENTHLTRNKDRDIFHPVYQGK